MPWPKSEFFAGSVGVIESVRVVLFWGEVFVKALYCVERPGV